MLYFHRQKLVILCQPKTGTTALHEAIRNEASIVFNTPPHMKHMTYGRFMKVMAPWIEQGDRFQRSNYTFISVMREPLDWFGSWYRYNSRVELKRRRGPGSARYTGDITFNQYLEALLLPRAEAPPYAQLGGACSIALDNERRIGVDRLFRYTDLDKLVALVSTILEKDITLGEANRSVERKTDYDPEIYEKIREKFKFEFDIYDKLKEDGSVAGINDMTAEDLTAESMTNQAV